MADAPLASGVPKADAAGTVAPLASGDRDVFVKSQPTAPFAHGKSREAVRRTRTARPNAHIATQAVCGG